MAKIIDELNSNEINFHHKHKTLRFLHFHRNIE